MLTNQEEKAWLMEKIGVDVMVFLDIEELEKGSGELETEILRRLGSSLVVSGEYGWAGLQGTDLCRVREVCDEKGRISTDRVRRALILGDMEYTAQLCGYPYIMMGRVVHGKPSEEPWVCPLQIWQCRLKTVSPKRSLRVFGKSGRSCLSGAYQYRSQTLCG